MKLAPWSSSRNYLFSFTPLNHNLLDENQHLQARAAFSDFFKKKDILGKNDAILQNRKVQPKVTVSIEPPAGVSKNVASERLKVMNLNSDTTTRSCVEVVQLELVQAARRKCKKVKSAIYFSISWCSLL